MWTLLDLSGPLLAHRKKGGESCCGAGPQRGPGTAGFPCLLPDAHTVTENCPLQEGAASNETALSLFLVFNEEFEGSGTKSWDVCVRIPRESSKEKRQDPGASSLGFKLTETCWAVLTLRAGSGKLPEGTHRRRRRKGAVASPSGTGPALGPWAH